MWIRDFSAVLLAGLFIILPAGACAPAEVRRSNRPPPAPMARQHPRA